MTLTSDPVTLNICNVSLMWWNSVQKLSAIEQAAAELLPFQYLTWRPWTCVMCCALLWKLLDTLQSISTAISQVYIAEVSLRAIDTDADVDASPSCSYVSAADRCSGATILTLSMFYKKKANNRNRCILSREWWRWGKEEGIRRRWQEKSPRTGYVCVLVQHRPPPRTSPPAASTTQQGHKISK